MRPSVCYVDFDGRSRNPTLNIGGTFSGGEGDKVNTVPAHARFSLDRRLVPGEQIVAVERELRRAVERAAEPPCRVAAPLRIEPCVVDAEHALPQAFAQAVQAVRRRTLLVTGSVLALRTCTTLRLTAACPALAMA